MLSTQGADIILHTDSVQWHEDDVTFTARLENVAQQALGTTDGRTADPRGIALIAAANAKQEVSTAYAVDAESRTDSTFGGRGVLARFIGLVPPGEMTAAHRLRLRLARGAAGGTLALLVIAPVEHAHGWLSVENEGLQVGRRTPLRARLFDAIGRPLPTSGITWAILTPDRGELSPAGDITAARAGVVRIVATCRPPCTATPDSTALSVSAPGSVTLTVRPERRHPISRFIYGANFITDDGAASTGLWPWFGADVPRGVTLNRIGGNRLSAYNWRTNYSHAGLDYRFQNDQLLDTSRVPGEAIRRRVAAARERGAATLVTIPMLPFLAGDADAQPLDTLGATRAARMRAHFVANRPVHAAGDPRDAVYQDDFVRFLSMAFPAQPADSARPLFYSLDNEPDLWHDTHRGIMSDTLGGRRKQTYDGFTATSIAYARAVKSVRADALVFGPATATYTGVANLGRYPDRDPVHGRAPFFEFYLDRMRAAELAGGRRLLDVLDMHWYAEAFTRGGPITNDYAPQDEETIQKRLQAPRSLWDSTYVEGSWVSDFTKGPIALIPRLRRMIAAHYPGTKIAITEYYYGRSGDISGGLAQADALGIFGREGVFAATLWPQANVWAWKGVGNDAYAYAFGAFRLFRDYDGAGSAFGDIGLAASTSDAAKASIYASRGADGRVVLIVINKTNGVLNASIPMATGPQPRSARVFTMQHGAPVPVRGPDIAVAGGAALTVAMPAYSASALVLEF